MYDRLHAAVDAVRAVSAFFSREGASYECESAGIIFDKGYGRIAILLSSILFMFSYFMLSLCTEYWQVFLAQGVGAVSAGYALVEGPSHAPSNQGLSLVCLFLPVYGSVCLYFANCKGASLAVGIGFAGGSVGGVVLPITLNRLIPLVGFPWATRACERAV
jgi:hypothetical protein